MTPYRRAIDATIATIDRRATLFRNHVVSVVVIVLLVGALSVALRTPEALSALLLLVPASGLAFFADHRLLHKWRGTVWKHGSRATLISSMASCRPFASDAATRNA